MVTQPTGTALQFQPEINDLVYDACPFCQDGLVFVPGAAKFKPCSVCGGRCWIIVNCQCICGQPITKISADKILYCGDDSCMYDLRTQRHLLPFQAPGAGRWVGRTFIPAHAIVTD